MTVTSAPGRTLRTAVRRDSAENETRTQTAPDGTKTLATWAADLTAMDHPLVVLRPKKRRLTLSITVVAKGLSSRRSPSSGDTQRKLREDRVGARLGGKTKLPPDAARCLGHIEEDFVVAGVARAPFGL
jgi:hypothetical protein